PVALDAEVDQVVRELAAVALARAADDEIAQDRRLAVAPRRVVDASGGNHDRESGGLHAGHRLEHERQAVVEAPRADELLFHGSLESGGGASRYRNRPAHARNRRPPRVLRGVIAHSIEVSVCETGGDGYHPQRARTGKARHGSNTGES